MASAAASSTSLHASQNNQNRRQFSSHPPHHHQQQQQVSNNIRPKNLNNILPNSFLDVQSNNIHSHQQLIQNQQNTYFFKKNNSNEFLVYKFNLNNLVWAKLNTYPWWPCKIVNDSNNECSKIVGKLTLDDERYEAVSDPIISF